MVSKWVITHLLTIYYLPGTSKHVGGVNLDDLMYVGMVVLGGMAGFISTVFFGCQLLGEGCKKIMTFGLSLQHKSSGYGLLVQKPQSCWLKVAWVMWEPQIS